MFNHFPNASNEVIGKIVLPPEIFLLFKIPLFRTNLFLVGGAVRDGLMGAKPSDYDFVCFVPEEKFRAVFPKALVQGQGTNVSYLVEYEGHSFDFCLLETKQMQLPLEAKLPKRKEFDKVKMGGLYSNALGRDFTVNALYYNPLSGIIDFFLGSKDIVERKITVIGNEISIFFLQPLRMLRAMRQAKQLNFYLENEYVEFFKNNHYLLHQVSDDRLKKEYEKFIKSFGVSETHDYLGEMNALSIFQSKNIIPDAIATEVKSANMLGLSLKSS